MRQGWSILVVFVCLAGMVSAADRPADPPSAPTSRPAFGEVVEVNVVNVDVRVTDRDGRPVSDLQRDDFEVFEDGKRVKVTNFAALKPEPGPEPPAVGAPGGAPPPGSTAPPRPEVPPEDRLHLIVYVDNYNLDPVHRTRVLRQVRAFLEDLRPEDRVMLVTHDMELRVELPFTGDPAAVEAALDKIGRQSAQGATAESERRTALQQILQIREAVRQVEGPCSRSIVPPAEIYAETTRQGVLRSIGAMTVLVNSLSGVPGRKALLHVSDGIPAIPGEEVFQLLYEICGGGSAAAGFGDVHDGQLEGPDAYDGRQALLDVQRYSTVQELDRLAAHANANRVTLYTLQASGLRGTAAAEAGYGPEDRLLQIPSIHSVQVSNLQNSLTLLASETGGQAILNANDVAPDLRRMKEELGTYYSLGYVPEHSGDGRVHRIEVRLRRPGLQVRHRRSYRDKPAIERAVDRTLAAVYHGFEDNPLEVTLKLGTQTPAEGGNRFLVPITLRIPLFKLGILQQEDRTYQGRLRLLVSTRDEHGGVSPIRQIEVPLRIPEAQILYAMGQFYEYELSLILPRGEQQVAITVRDEATATASVLSRTLTVGTADSR
jgi:VWFA-related protein